ncbi:MAG: class I SAM-dependent methyltransferase [Xenococcaceae cyanobacterium MO_207.B15]|nr:class I SAM-dependent methyltransferase [Xenococcaceae cyanobacterium MO_207.B15]MDJ0742720.1 class I SAM-dependent methyltransferase [Xenococcaceae cyanobacterium MO_167.B27]
MFQSLSNQYISRLVWHLYCDAPTLTRLLALARTFICPMQRLLAEVPKGSTLLDIGCGKGIFLLLLATNNQMSSAMGIDPDGKALHIAKKAMAKVANQSEKVNINFIPGSSPEDWPQDTYFSVVSLIDVMHHIPPEQQYWLFCEAVKRVAPGGRLIYKDMCHRPFWLATANRLHDLIVARQWINYVPLDTIKHWGLSLGLELKTESFYLSYVYGHEKLVFNKPLI